MTLIGILQGGGVGFGVGVEGVGETELKSELELVRVGVVHTTTYGHECNEWIHMSVSKWPSSEYQAKDCAMCTRSDDEYKEEAKGGVDDEGEDDGALLGAHARDVLSGSQQSDNGGRV